MATSIYSEFSFEILTFKQLPLKRSSFGRQRESLRVASKASRRLMCWSDNHFWWLLWLMTHTFSRSWFISVRCWKEFHRGLLNERCIGRYCSAIQRSSFSVVFGVRKNQNLLYKIAPGWRSTKFQDSTFRQEKSAITPDFCHIHITLNSIHMIGSWSIFGHCEDLVPLDRNYCQVPALGWNWTI